MAKHGKKYLEAVKLLESTKEYSPQEAIELAKKMARSRFDETVELHLRMNLDPRDANQQVRGVALLPHGLGKRIRVLVFTQGEAERIAEKAGADYVGSDDLVKKIEDGWLEFDITIATPDMMGKVSKLGKILGRRGLMPNPKSGTVVPVSDLPRAIENARQGRVEFRLDRTAIIHLPLGKAGFDSEKLMGNLSAVVEAVMKARPSGAKGQYVKSAYLATTMSPGIKLDLRPTLAMAAAAV
ncbi:MAG: 50S ribosomal protein L1 [Chloroflexi bacterium]|nr:50S ribosomal protein L1 [Chloroflexota bacterium]